MIANAAPDAVGVIALVGDDDGARLEALEQDLGGRDVVIVARRDQDADRPTFRVDARVDLGRDAASASTDTRNSTLFLTPEAC